MLGFRFPVGIDFRSALEAFHFRIRHTIAVDIHDIQETFVGQSEIMVSEVSARLIYCLIQIHGRHFVEDRRPVPVHHHCGMILEV